MPIIQPCTPDRWDAALAFLGEDGREQPGEAARFWLARRGERIVGAIRTWERSDGVVWLEAPVVRWGRGWSRVDLASGLVRTVLEAAERRGDRIAQALVPAPADADTAVGLIRGGLRLITDVHALERPTSPQLASGAVRPSLAWRSWDEAGHWAFRDVFAESIRDGGDLPELGLVRTFDDVLAAQRQDGAFDPSGWWLGGVADGPDVAIWGVAPCPGPDFAELVYLGVTPAGRRRGIGWRALGLALDWARPRAARLILKVDARNASALRLYERADFHPYRAETLFLKVFR